jgi:hypothetical protein
MKDGFSISTPTRTRTSARPAAGSRDFFSRKQCTGRTIRYDETSGLLVARIAPVKRLLDRGLRGMFFRFSNELDRRAIVSAGRLRSAPLPKPFRRDGSAKW